MCKIFSDLSGLSRTWDLGRYLLLTIHKTFFKLLFIVVYHCAMFYSIIHPKVYLLLLWILILILINVVAPVNRDRSKSTPETIPQGLT